MIGEYGNAGDPERALSDYAKRIRGKTLVFDAHGNNRREFGVPMSLE